MITTKNAAGSHTPAAPKKLNQISYTNNIVSIQRIPIRLQRHPDQLPKSLKQLNQWCIAGENKEPLNTSGYRIDVINPANWASFTEIVRVSNNIGFILIGTNVVVVDVDHCVHPDGTLNDIALELLELLPTYTEFSQSQMGLHFIFRDDDIPADFTGRKGTIEIYADRRYVALTGWRMADTPADVTTLNGITRQLLDTYFPNTDYNSSDDFQTVLEQHSYNPVQSDEEVLQSLQNNQKFQRLYAGDISGYPSQSEADGAMMLILATATGRNATQMRRLFSQSTLSKRDKWVNRTWYQQYLVVRAIRFAKLKENSEMENTMSDNLTLKIYNQTLFSTEQNEYVSQAIRKTGFPTIDKYMGFPPGVYCLAAISSAGKTAFSIQLGYQLAQQGESVIYVGYETTRLEVCSRILARLMKQLNPASQFSAFDIRSGIYNDDPYYQVARQIIDKTDPQFRIWSTTSQDNINHLIQRIQNFMEANPSEKPIVIIDYLQIIPHTGDLKRMIDEDLPKIKMFQQSTGTTFLILSSTNRASYKYDMGVEAFKESGVIEFSADVIWMLQYSILDNGGNLTTNRLKTEKACNPRKMTLKCLKNRNGNDYEVHFDYHSKFDWFVETTNAMDNQKEWKTATQI